MVLTNASILSFSESCSTMTTSVVEMNEEILAAPRASCNDENDSSGGGPDENDTEVPDKERRQSDKSNDTTIKDDKKTRPKSLFASVRRKSRGSKEKSNKKPGGSPPGKSHLNRDMIECNSHITGAKFNH